MKHLFYLGLIAITTLFYQCSNSQKLLSNGNYEKSYKVSLKELKKGKASKADVEVLNTSLSKIYDQKIEAVLESENGTSLDDGVAAHDGYLELENKFEQAIKYLNVKNNEQYTSLISRRENLGNELYEDFKKAGLVELQQARDQDNRRAGQAAYENFEFAQQYNSTSEIVDLLEEAYQYAVTILVVETDAPYNGSFDFDIEREFKRVENNENKFQRAFYERNQDDADCLIKIVFEPFDFGSNFRTYNRDFSREIDVNRTVTNAEGQQVVISERETVFCTLTVDQYLSGLRIYADIAVVAQSKYCNSSRDTYQDFYEEVYEEYRVAGDRRALPPEFSQNSNGQRVRDSDLVEILMRRFYNQFALEYL